MSLTSIVAAHPELVLQALVDTCQALKGPETYLNPHKPEDSKDFGLYRDQLLYAGGRVLARRTSEDQREPPGIVLYVVRGVVKPLGLPGLRWHLVKWRNGKSARWSDGAAHTMARPPASVCETCPHLVSCTLREAL